MENAYTEIPSGRILPAFLSIFRNPGKTTGRIREAQGRLVRVLGIEREAPLFKKAIRAQGLWGEKNDVSFDAFDAPQAIPCKPIRSWAMILQENKIRK